ncbi:interleukin-27 subunit beta isoform X2 [Choloepus didactylus]|uniref:interleukin-27 subunit beta isoform X2 n=1 Tax=Choloepus didactylus TaxID=27675 RepID=UPI00189D024D|nr:interleukin-27 subunit beta isoform X2 [Choloepus didactylus]
MPRRCWPAPLCFRVSVRPSLGLASGLVQTLVTVMVALGRCPFGWLSFLLGLCVCPCLLSFSPVPFLLWPSLSFSMSSPPSLGVPPPAGAGRKAGDRPCWERPPGPRRFLFLSPFPLPLSCGLHRDSAPGEGRGGRPDPAPGLSSPLQADPSSPPWSSMIPRLLLALALWVGCTPCGGREAAPTPPRVRCQAPRYPVAVDCSWTLPPAPNSTGNTSFVATYRSESLGREREGPRDVLGTWWEFQYSGATAPSLGRHGDSGCGVRNPRSSEFSRSAVQRKRFLKLHIPSHI